MGKTKEQKGDQPEVEYLARAAEVLIGVPLPEDDADRREEIFRRAEKASALLAQSESDVCCCL